MSSPILNSNVNTVISDMNNIESSTESDSSNEIYIILIIIPIEIILQIVIELVLEKVGILILEIEKIIISLLIM